MLTSEVRDLRCQGFRVIVQGDLNGWVGNVAEIGGIPGNREKVNPNGELLLTFLSNNFLTNVNGATRVVHGEPQKICQGLWTRHAKDYVSSSVIDYVLVSKEHLGSVIEMTIDQDGRLGGGSDHNMIISRWKDKFISIPKVEPVRKPGWDIQNANWAKFRSIVEDKIADQALKRCDIESLSNSLSRILTKGLSLAVGRKPNFPQKQKLYPRHIVTLMKERKILERVFKTAKSKFADSIGDQFASDSLVIAKVNLDSKTAELNEAKSRFDGQQRSPLLNIAKSKNKKDRRRFWDYVKGKPKSL